MTPKKTVKKDTFSLTYEQIQQLCELYKSEETLYTCSQNRQSTKFQNHENINFVEKLYFFILYNQVYIVKHGVKSLH